MAVVAEYYGELGYIWNVCPRPGAPGSHAASQQGGDRGGAGSSLGLPECAHSYSGHRNA